MDQESELFTVTQNALLANSLGEILILCHKSGKWLLPGGKLIKGETWEDGLKREIFEETGIEDSKIKQILSVNSWLDFDNAPKYGVIFLCETNTFNVKISEEHANYKWVSSNDFNEYEYWHPTILNQLSNYFERT